MIYDSNGNKRPFIQGFISSGITIPDGYEAVIKGNKIIFQKKESEDEKTRKKIVAIFKTITDCDEKEREKILNWLEKQKEDYSSFPEEQRKYMEKYIPLDKVTLVKLLAERDENAKKIIESFEKQNAEKPIFKVGDTIIAKDGNCIPKELFHIEKIEDDTYWDGDCSILVCNQHEFQLVNQQPTEIGPNQWDGITYGMGGHSDKPTEQGKEKLDDFTSNIRDLIIRKLTTKSKGSDRSEITCTVFIDDNTAKDIVNGVLFYVGKEAMKNPNREIPQWNEDDEKAIHFINEFLGYHEASDPTAKSCKAWLNERLKSLRPSWKPSEEQMAALKNSAYGTYQNGDGPALRDLYEQLKKL